MSMTARVAFWLAGLSLVGCHSTDSIEGVGVGVAHAEAAASNHAKVSPPVSGTGSASAPATPLASASSKSQPSPPAGSPPSAAAIERLQVAGLDANDAKRFFDQLKANVAKDDRAAVCPMAHYPLPVNSLHSKQKIANDAACRAGYDRIFTAPVVQAVANQSFDDLNATSTGVMIGDGALWFAGICDDAKCSHSAIRISAINN